MRFVLKRAGATTAAALTWVGLTAALVAGVAGCSGDLDIGGVDGVKDVVAGKARSPREVILVTPEDGAKGVKADGRIEVRVPGGRLERVRVMKSEDAQPEEVPGRITDDGLSWEPTRGAAGRLELAAKYTVDAVALDGHGHRQARHTSFTTLVPEHRFIGYFKPENRSTVGVGMIVSFNFNQPIENRAAVERAIRVTSKPPVEVVGHWFGKERLDFRPRQYWKPGTKVTVDMRMRDVPGAPGVYGIQEKRIGFTIGRDQESLVDADAHTMEVRRGGELVSTVPISAGSPKNTTYNGKMVVTEMFDVTRMNSRTVGFGGEYDIPDVPHAIRLTASGTFLHGNYWASSGTFGSSNTSHGCVGLRDVKGGSPDTPAGWFFDRTLVGDVVEVINSRDKTVAPDNGLGGWNLDWAKWRAGSAL
ncbi:Ig-like domain-containing protein [Streptomyces sp. TLI_146]|uniref:L,D-transpeptidase n=1 Tax=Streptomyces sp. TLI_146 TaxID=1938858 RepID=UPI000C713E02|nr:Ig-like domain-containing protein [Streptomyces sp. TLI_146]PKV88000.1 lipoprotein-anchoring transpeptidase ErfK/SrfK [Streptomyces sp. TLI_146]